jgi:hypothetical protein
MKTTTPHINGLSVLGVLLLALVGAAFLRPADAAAYGWPVKPFHRQHAVRGYFGDPRIDGSMQGLHFGVDVVAPNGTPVYATQDGSVSIHPRHPSTVSVSGGGRVFEYWHVVPAVRPGQWARAYTTVVGYVQAPWEHVHFAENLGGRHLNPLRAGALQPYRDTTRPEVGELTAERAGAPVRRLRLTGRVDLIAEVRDWMPIAAPQPWRGKPVMPALVRWRLLGPRGGAGSWSTAVDFRAALPPCGFTGVYAQWTRQNKPSHVGRYRVYLVHGLDTTALRDGTHRVEVEVTDTAGNRSRRAQAVAVRNG